MDERTIKVSRICNVAAGVVDVLVGDSENYTNGGILSNSKLSWVSSGSRITTINNSDGSKLTGWTFGWNLRDPSHRIVCVEELSVGNKADPILIVATESECNGSSLCFYHSGSSRVLKSIHFSDKISSLGVVSRKNYPEENLSSRLKSWNGILAVGTGIGKVLLLDIWWKGLQTCIEDHHQKLFNEQRQSKLVEVKVQDLLDDVECKPNHLRNGSATLALWLNEDTLRRGRSSINTRIENILGRMPQEFLTVSALEFFPQIGTLAVGYNTSCFQLWDLTSLNLLYTSALLETMLPVYSFSFLEPLDDPRFVCYLWSFHHSVDEDSIPFAGMYILNYHEKHTNDYSKQHFYEGFSSCNIRYQLDLGAEMDDVVSGKILSCQAIRQPSESKDEGTASLLMIAWEVWTSHQQSTYTRLTLFDVNQWYREYMPQTSDSEYSHFMTHFCLPDSSPLDICVVPSSVRQFDTLHPMDEHFYPSAFSFNCICLHEAQVLHCSHTGIQRECVNALREAGPSALLLPSRLYKMCTNAGIRPVLTDSTVSSPNSKEHRDFLLSIALEFDMVGFLHNCVRDWSDGSHAVAGCTLPSLLQWACSRVQAFKIWLDKVCVPLFNYSGTTLDSNDLAQFQHMICQFHRLQDLYKLVLTKYSNCILPGNFKTQHIAISVVRDFYSAVLWCVKTEVLPETNVGDAKSFLPYHADLITNATISRRAELHQRARSLCVAVPVNSLLMIDALISEEAGGNRLTDQWEREGGSVTVGKYPPPSVQSLLRTYLVCGISAQVKHMIVTYFLHDLVFALGQHHVSESTRQQVLHFPEDCGLSLSRRLIAKAFWYLDHQNYKEGVSMLLHSSVDETDLQGYVHHSVLCLLISASEHKLALHYMNIRKPNLPDQQDIKIKMTLLLLNNLIHEAFQFQQHHQSMKDELIQQFFKGCVEMKKLDVVFKLPLNTAEEQAFLAYLTKCSLPYADDFRVYYLITRSRYTEAIDLNEKLRGNKASRLPLGYSGLGQRGRNIFGAKDETGAPVKTVFTTRDHIVNSLAKCLPSVTKELADYCCKEKKYNWKQVDRPTPLSMVVHTDLSCERLPFYKTTETMLLHAAVKKSRETWAATLGTPAAATQVLKRKLCSELEDAPFLRTPKIDDRLSNVSPERCRSVLKRARLELSPQTPRTVTSYKPVDMEMTAPETAALLHTPLVPRATRRHARDTGTPHSILKGSAANTPTTPARGDVNTNRQIRFSLPGEKPSPSTTGSLDDGDSEEYSPKLSPRRSIHDATLSVRERKGTPANPRAFRQSLSFRSGVTQLKFEDEDTETVKPRQSATAATLLKNISASSMSSDSSFVSLKSSVSSRGSVEPYRLSLGLEGNIVPQSSCNQPLEETLVHDESLHSDLKNVSTEEVNRTTVVLAAENNVNHGTNKEKEIVGNQSIDSEVPRNDAKSSLKINHQESFADDYQIDPKSPENYKNIVIKFTNPSPFLNRTKGDLHNSLNKNSHNSVLSSCGDESEDEKRPVLKWRDGSKDSPELEICKVDKAGLEQHVATVTVSQTIPLYSSKAVNTAVVNKQPESSLLPVEQEKTLDESLEKKLIPPQAQPCLNNTLETSTSTLSEESFSEELQSNKAVFSSTWINTSKLNAEMSSTSEIKGEEEELPNIRSSLSTTTIGEMPLEQVLDELVRKKKICSLVKKTSYSSKEEAVEDCSIVRAVSQTSVKESRSGIQPEVVKEDEAAVWNEELEDDINLSYHESTQNIEDKSNRCDNSEISSPEPSVKGYCEYGSSNTVGRTSNKVFSSSIEEERVSSQNKLDARDPTEVSEPEEGSVSIAPTLSSTNVSFGFRSESVGDFELRLSEGESMYEDLQEEEDEEEEESTETVSTQVANSTTKVEAKINEVTTDEKSEISKEVEVTEEVEMSKEDNAAEDAATATEEAATATEEAATATEEAASATEEKEETEPQPSYQTLTSVNYNEDNEEYLDEEYLEEPEEDVDVETEDVDLYDDLDDAPQSPQQVHYDDDDEVICLESDSEEKSTQTRRVLPESGLHETLDYEEDDSVDDEEHQDDKYHVDETGSYNSEGKEDSSYLSSSESTISSSVLSSSENEACHGNRSWKGEKTRTVDKKPSEDESSVGSIESPPFEVIEHDSPSKQSNIKPTIERTHSSTSDNTDLEKSSSNKSLNVPENVQSDISINVENEEECCFKGDLQVEEGNGEENNAETLFSLENPVQEDVKAIDVFQLELKTNQLDNLSVHVEQVEGTCTDNKPQTEEVDEQMIAEISVSNENTNFEDREAVDVLQSELNETMEKFEKMEKEMSKNESGDGKIEEAINLLKQALDKRDKFVETGSITDLKKKRLKRYNSIQNMTQSNKTRLRRRSLSHHDLTSMRIVDEKSSSSMSIEEDEVKNLDLHQSCSLENVVNLTNDKQENDASSSEVISNQSLTVTSESSESCNVGLTVDLQTLNTEKQIDSLKRQRLLKNHTTSLQDITEESLESTRNSIGRMNNLRRSVSTSAIDGQMDSNILPGGTSSLSQASRPLNETKPLNNDKTETLSKEAEEKESLSQNENVINKEKSNEKTISEHEELSRVEEENLTIKEESDSFKNKDKLEAQEMSHNASKYEIFGLKSINRDNKVEQSVSDLDSPACHTRRKRAQSESFSLEVETTNLPSRRRRSSSLKIQDVQKRILSRSSNSRYSHKINFQPMEILNSDEDSFTEQKHTTNQEKTSSNELGTVHSNVDKKENPDNELPELNESEETSVGLPSTNELPSVQEETETNQREEKRGTSEPPANQVVKKARVKKSASLQKLESIHKLILGRQSLRKSVASKTLVNLEVIQSSEDEKSFHKDSEPSPVPSTSNAETKEKITKPKKRAIKEHVELLDSPARRTRRSLSRLSETESLNTPFEVITKKRNKKETKTMEELDESGCSDISKTSSRLNTPTRRSTRIQSLSNTPTLTPEEHLSQRKLTRRQLQKQLEMSITGSPMLEDVPEVVDEREEVLNVSTPKRAPSKKSTSKSSKRSKK